MGKKIYSALILAVTGLLGTQGVGAQNTPLAFDFGATPYFSLPVANETDIFRMGAGSDLFGELTIPGTTVTAGAVFDYNWLSTYLPGTTLSSYGIGLRSTVGIPLAGPLSASLLASGGEYYVGMNGGSGGGYDPWAQGGVALNFKLADTVFVSTEGDFRYRFGWISDVRLSLMGRFQPGPPRPAPVEFKVKPGFTPFLLDQKGLKLTAYKAETLYPAFFHYYSEHRVAQVVLHNFERVPAEGIELSADMKGYTTGPKVLAVPPRLGPGEEVVVDLEASFNDQLLTLDPNGPPPAIILTLTYIQDGKKRSDSGSPTLVFQPRNSREGSDDRQLAAFISPADPAASAFAKKVRNEVRGIPIPALSPEIQTAMAFAEALRYRKMTQENDHAAGIETVNFPQETLVSRAGDAEELAVLWCSLLESQGISTAILKVHGRILLAFALDSVPEVAQEWWGKPDSFLIKDGKAWVPVDPTANLGFLEDWASGVSLTASAEDDLKFIPVHEAWSDYPPAAVPQDYKASDLVLSPKVKGSMKTVLDSYIIRELNPREAEIQEQLKKASDPAQIDKLENRLGILYARFGQYDQSAGLFKRLVTMGYTPATVNLAYITLLSGDSKTAVEQFETALRVTKNDKADLTGLALGYQTRGDQPKWTGTISLLSKVDKAQADRLLARNPATDTLMPFILWNE